MRIVIVGAGSVGTHLAKYLSGEKMDIFIIDKDPSKLTMLDSEYNLMTIEGDGTQFSTLRHADVGKSELFIAVTDVTERNIVLCGIAKSMGAKMTVARVDRQDYIESHNIEALHSMGVDHAIFPEYLLAKGINEALKHPWTRNWYEFNKGKMIILGIHLSNNAPIVGRYLRELSQGQRFFHVVAIRRHFTTLIPKGDTQLLPDDTLYVIISAFDQEQLASITGKHLYDIKNVLIAGGGKIVEMTLETAPKTFKFTVIDNDVNRAKTLTRQCPACDVLVGGASELNVLEEAGIGDADAFVSLTDSSEGNILTCLIAKDLGIKKTIADIEQPYFFNMGESFNISTILNKQMQMANTIFQLMIDSGSFSSKCLVLPDADVVKLEIKTASRITSVPIKDLKVPEEITFAGYIRNDQSEVITGQTVLQVGDHVLVVCLKGGLQKAQKLLNGSA
jgi:K+ transport systems, NAD-binding component